MKHTRDSAIAEVEIRRQEVDRLVEVSGRLRNALDNQLRLLNLPGADKASQSERVMAAKSRVDVAEAKVSDAVECLNDMIRTLNNRALLREGNEEEPQEPGVDEESVAPSIDASPAMPKRARGKK